MDPHMKGSASSDREGAVVKRWFVAGLTCLLAAGAGAEDGRLLVKRLLTPETSLEELPGIMDRLVELAPVAELEEALAPDKIGLTEAERIATVLARIDSPQSRSVLRKMLFTSAYITSDIADWGRLIALLVAGQAGKPGGLEHTLHQLLPRYARDALKGAAAVGEPSKRIKHGIVAGLNQVLNKEDLYKLLMQKSEKFDAEVEELLRRHERSGGRLAPGKGLALIELQRLNRRLLDARMAGIVKPLAGYDIHQFNTKLIDAAHAALKLLKSEEGRELRLGYQPVNFRERLAHIENLKGEEGPDVIEAFAELLIDEEIAISKRAKDEILKRLEADPGAVKDAMEGLVTRLRFMELKPELHRGLSNTLEICVSLPEPRASAGLLAEIFSFGKEDLAELALEALWKRPELAGEKELFEALSNAATKAEGTEVPTRILKIMMHARIKDGVWIAKDLLDHSDPAVRALAVRFLRMFSGEDRGPVPEAWASYTPPAPPFAEGAVEVAPEEGPPKPKEPAPEEAGSDLWIYLTAAAVVGLAIILVTARQLAIRRRLRQLDNTRKRRREQDFKDLVT